MSAALPPLEQEASPRARRIRHLTGSVAREILALTQRRDVISFAGGLPDPALFPEVGEWPTGWEQYGCSEGEPALREQLFAQVRASGVPLRALEQLVVTAGSQQGLDLAAKLWIDPGSVVLTEAPTYLAAVQVFRLFEASFGALRLEPEGLDPVALEASLRRERPALVYLNPTFQNPSGVCHTVDNRRAVAAVLDRHAVPLVEDDPYRDLYYGAHPPPPMVSFLERAPWVYLGSLSKTLMPGLRLGFAASSGDVAGDMLKLKQAADLHTNRLGQLIASRLLADGAQRGAQLVRLRGAYRSRRDAMERALRAAFAEDADWTVPDGGMFFWLRLRRPVALRAWLERALAAGVAFMPGDDFFAPGAVVEPAVRLNFTRSEASAIARGVGLLRASFDARPVDRPGLS